MTTNCVNIMFDMDLMLDLLIFFEVHYKQPD